MTMLTRHAIRQVTFQTLFGLAVNPDAEMEPMIEQVLAGDPEVEREIEAPEEVIDLVRNVQAYQDDADLQISRYLVEGWTLERLNLVDLEIMRIAIYEAQKGNTPAKVAVNEALNLASDFTDEASSKFINGVLSKVLTF